MLKLAMQKCRKHFLTIVWIILYSMQFKLDSVVCKNVISAQVLADGLFAPELVLFLVQLLSMCCVSWCFTAAPVCQGSKRSFQPDSPEPPSGPGQPTAQPETMEASCTGKEPPSVCQMVMTLHVCVLLCANVLIGLCACMYVCMVGLPTIECGVCGKVGYSCVGRWAWLWVGRCMWLWVGGCGCIGVALL